MLAGSGSLLVSLGILLGTFDAFVCQLYDEGRDANGGAENGEWVYHCACTEGHKDHSFARKTPNAKRKTQNTKTALHDPTPHQFFFSDNSL
jgi:hypothetical protein